MARFLNLILLSFFFSSTLFAQKAPIIYQETVQLDLPQTTIQEDYFYFKAYVYSNNKTSKEVASGVLNVLLKDSNGTILKRQQHAIINGAVHGGVALPKRIPSGKYTLEAYTQWMLNFDHLETASVSICLACDKETLGNNNEEPSTIVAIEGGVMVNGLPAKIIVKIPNQDEHKSTSGNIIDQKGTYVTTVNTVGAAYGAALFTPLPDNDYFFQAADGVKYALPKAVNEGFVININTLDKQYLLVQVAASNTIKKQKVNLVGYSKGMIILQKELQVDSHKPIHIELSKNELPAGRVDLYIIDNKEVIKSYRPIAVTHNHTEIRTEVVAKTEKETQLKIKVLDHLDKGTTSSISLAVYSNDSDTSVVDTQKPDDRQQVFIEDMQILAANTPKQLEFLKIPSKNDNNYDVQRGLNLVGTAYDLNNRILRNERIEVMASSDQGVHIEEVVTNDQGILRLENMELLGENQIIFRKEADDLKSRLVKLVPLGESEKPKNKVVIASTPAALIKEQEKKDAETLPFDTTDAVVLDQVNIKRSKLEKRKATPSLYGADPSPTKISFQDFEKPKTIPQLLQRIPGLVVTNPNDLEPTIWRPSAAGAGGLLFVVDGILLQQPADVANSFASSVQTNLRILMDMVSSSDVERIEFLDGVEAAVFGSRAGGGVIAVYTRFGGDPSLSRKEGSLQFQGYEPELPFNSYWQELPRSKRKNAELIYWNSKIALDQNGEVIVTIPNQDNISPKTYRIVTVDTKGSFISQQHSF